MTKLHQAEQIANAIHLLTIPQRTEAEENQAVEILRSLHKELLQQPEQSAWISVEDRLPEKAGEYLIAIKEVEPTVFGKDVRYRVAIKYINHNSWSAYATGTISINDKITHWQPLPEPPTE